ncbi:MAG: homocysteine S-methyltransferase family protein, partial [bacterium]
MKQSLLEVVRTRVLLSDGAMGTQLQLAGLEAGGCGEAWNADQPDRVAAIQKRYAEAGSDCLITNTFGCSRFRLSLHGQDGRVHELNKAAAQIARKVIGPDRYVLGDIGPFGGFLEPLGETTREELIEEFEKQASALAEGGADAIIIETMTALDELECAIEASKRATKLPVIASMAFDKIQDGSYRTMMGVTPKQGVELMVSAGADVVGANCGTGLDIRDYVKIVEAFRA